MSSSLSSPVLPISTALPSNQSQPIQPKKDPALPHTTATPKSKWSWPLSFHQREASKWNMQKMTTDRTRARYGVWVIQKGKCHVWLTRSWQLFIWKTTRGGRGGVPCVKTGNISIKESRRQQTSINWWKMKHYKQNIGTKCHEMYSKLYLGTKPQGFTKSLNSHMVAQGFFIRFSSPVPSASSISKRGAAPNKTTCSREVMIKSA